MQTKMESWYVYVNSGQISGGGSITPRPRAILLLKMHNIPSSAGIYLGGDKGSKKAKQKFLLEPSKRKERRVDSLAF